MSAVKFIGSYDTLAEGKFLLEVLASSEPLHSDCSHTHKTGWFNQNLTMILLQLRQYGVGRMVTKNEWLRKWPDQPSYILVRKVEAQMDRWMSKGKVWGDWIYRGKPLGVYQFNRDLDRSDWKLIHKHDESAYKTCSKPFENLQVPSQLPMPPLMRFLWQQEQAKLGKDAAEIPMLPTIHHMDKDFEMLQPFIKLNADLNAPANASIYDCKPDNFLDLYGKELPTRVEAWKSFPDYLTEDYDDL